MVEETKMKPKKRSSAFLRSCLYAVATYMRMVEPLIIARYYRQGGKDHVTKKRAQNFVLLEEWFRNEMKRAKTSNVEEAILIDFCALIDKAILSRQETMVYEEIDDHGGLFMK